MKVFSFSDLIIFFTIYSVLGYCCEVIYCSIIQKKLVNRGVLFGPYCPIYGFGAILVIIILKPFSENILVLFVAAIIITGVLEYFTSWLLEKLFNMQWWDYSNHKFNIHGRVCLLNALEFGFLSVAVVKFINPFFVRMVGNISDVNKTAISSFILLMFTTDIIFTLNSLMNLESILKEVDNLLISIKTNADKYIENIGHIKDYLNKVEEQAKIKKDGQTIELINKYEKLVTKAKINFRILRTYPKLRHISSNNTLNLFKEIISDKFENISTKTQEAISKININSLKDKALESSNLKLVYKLFWVFFSAGVIGFVLESFFGFIINKEYVVRQGLLYGPFIQTYGIVAVILVVLFDKKDNLKSWLIFLYSFLITGIYEVISSYLQEKIFHSVSWAYKILSMFEGKTSLISMLYGGALGFIFIKFIYPKILIFVKRIPSKQGWFIRGVIFITLFLNIVISGIAVYRWSARARGNEASNKFETLIDNHYDDRFMENIYPNMIIKK